MDENTENNYENKCETHYENKDCFCKHPVLKYILVGLMIFLGSFCASYVLNDWHYKRMAFATDFKNIEHEMMRQERDMLKQHDNFERNFNKSMERNFKRSMVQTPNFMRVEKMKDAYKISIDLTPFDNNEKNVEVKVEGNAVVINAAGERASKQGQEIVRYSQTIGFGEDIKAKDITKVREGNNYIITVPFD